MKTLSGDERQERTAAGSHLLVAWLLGLLGACVLAGAGGYLAAGPADRDPDARDGAPASPATPSSEHAPARLKESIAFATSEDQPEESAALLDADSLCIYGFFALPQTPPPAELQALWWWNGEEMGKAEIEDTSCEADRQQRGRVTLKPPAGGEFGAGVGELEIRHQGRRVVRGSFVTTEKASAILAQDVPPVACPRIASMDMARGIDGEGKPVGATVEFRGDERVWVAFEYADADAGAAFVVRWFCADHELPRARATITAQAQGGTGSAWIQAGGATRLPPAEYKVGVHYGSDEEPLATRLFRILSTELDKDTPGSSGPPQSDSSPRRRSNSSASE